MKFEGTQAYVATDDLKLAVNAAITLERPLLVKGEPGTGKTMLAEQLAESFGAKLITWHIKSTTKAHQGLYEYGRGQPPARLAVGRGQGARRAQLPEERQALGSLRVR